jgi:hypothetical protein
VLKLKITKNRIRIGLPSRDYLGIEYMIKFALLHDGIVSYSEKRGGRGMNGKFWGNVGLSAVIFCLAALAVTKINASSTGIAGVLLPEVKVSDSAEELLHSVALVHSAVKIPKEGHMIDASFALENKGGHDIKNISILCTLYDAAGIEQGRDKWVVFDTVKSQTKGSFTFYDKMFISDSVVRSDCRIVDMQIARAPKVQAHGATTGQESSTDEHGAAAQGSQH